MAHQSHLKSEKYRQWVKAGLGLGYLKEGLAPFCDDVAKQQHKDIIDNVKLTKHISSIICGTCSLRSLKPDHVKCGNKQCPFGHANCNCCYTAGKIPCPNNVCGAIYDNIITYHASTPPVPNWKNTQTQQWIADPWSIAKCFINAPGYEQKTSAADTDCTGLLHVIINNKYFHNHVNMTGPNIFSKVRQYRNEIFHSSTMELDSTKTNGYIDDMIAVLQDGKKLIHRQDAQEAVKKLQDLKNEDFIITTEDVEKVLGDIREEMGSIKITMEATKEDYEDLKKKVATLETVISELKEVIKNLKDDSSKRKTDFETLKTDLREKLIEEYKQNLLQVSAMPCQPEELCNFEDVYVTPRVIIKSKDTDKQEIETDMKKLSDIFIIDDKPLKSIYILGGAGSGKSTFCKSLVQCWCMVHSDTQDLDSQEVKENIEDHVDSFKVMKKFNFLFFLPLRHCIDKLSIKDMLEEEYEHPVLKELLERESETCLIVLDGLDEWTNRAKSPPKRAKFCNYTVITTSRPWKISSLEISDNEMKQSIHMSGFGAISKNNIITKTVKILNKTFKKHKDPRNCEDALNNETFDSLTHTAMMIQQLICLWFDERLIATSKCNLYASMLDLFFVWYKKKFPDEPLVKDMRNKSVCVELPEYLNKRDESHSYIIRDLSRLAYETLIKNEKETSLTFDNSVFQQLDLSDDIKDCCLKVGILSEEKGPSLSASRSRKLHISFIHKTIQEYLAAVYIVMNIKTEQKSSLDPFRADLSDYLSKMFNVKNVDEILEQENVLTMLCGLEPGLAKSLSKFVYDIVAMDDRVVLYRTTIDIFFRDLSFIENIQTLIINCTEETIASERRCFDLYLGDLVFKCDKDIYLLKSRNNILGDVYNDDKETRLLEFLEEHNITFDSAISFCICNRLGEFDRRIFFFMKRCRNLEAIIVDFNFEESLYQLLCDSIERNATTLKCLFLSSNCLVLGFTDPQHPNRRLFRHMADMTHLVALHVQGFTVKHADFTYLCTFLSGTGNLQQLAIRIQCECKQQHEVDLSKHKQLQYMNYDESIVVRNADFTNLEKYRCCSLNQTNCVKVFDFLSKSVKLQSISLGYNFSSLKENMLKDNDESNHYVTVTSLVSELLSSLHQLKFVAFKNILFTDNIILSPSEMKSIETFDLSYVTMSLTTWRKVVDSVVVLPQPVSFNAKFMYITRDGEEFNQDLTKLIRRGGEEEAAFQYVEEYEALCDVKVLDINRRAICISTKE